MNCGIGAMGPYNHANATIGRAYGLLSQNLQGGSVPGETYMGSHRQQLQLQQHHLRRERGAQPVGAAPRAEGVQADRQHVSIFYGCRSTTFCLGLREKYWREHVRDMLLGIDAITRADLPARPDHGAAIHRSRRLRHQGQARCAGFTRPRRCRPAAIGTCSSCRITAIPGRPSAASRCDQAQGRAGRADLDLGRKRVNVVVVGGETNGYWQIMGAEYRKTVSIDSWR